MLIKSSKNLEERREHIGVLCRKAEQEGQGVMRRTEVRGEGVGSECKCKEQGGGITDLQARPGDQFGGAEGLKGE